MRAIIYSDDIQLLGLNAERAVNLIGTLDQHLKDMRYRTPQEPGLAPNQMGLGGLGSIDVFLEQIIILGPQLFRTVYALTR